MRHDEHVSPEQLAAYLAGSLDDRAAEQVQAHLGECPSCCTEALSVPEDPLAAEVREAWRVYRGAMPDTLFETLPLAAPDAASSSLPIRERLGEYRLLREIGRGGMGIIYEAVHEPLGRQVALKVLSPQATLDPRYVRRFEREAKAAARLHHTNIVPVFGVGACDGVQFYLMQFIRGRSLDQVLRDSGPRPPEEVARLGRQAAEALAYAHTQSVLHRDIKPSNLLVDEQGTLWVTDFGLAKLEDETALTRSGDMMGTLRYLAPERLDGPGDARSDVHALGLTLYELLCGRPAFDAADHTPLMKQVQHGEATTPRQLRPNVPADLETIILKAMAREPGNRYPTAAALADDLRRFQADESILARPPSVAARCGRFARRNKAVVIGLGAVMASLALGLVIAAVFAVGEARQRALADAARHEAERGNYLARVSVAARTLEDLGSRELARQLDAAPVDWRHWEWFYLRARLDESLAFFSVPTQVHDWVLGFPAFYPPGERLATCQGRQVWLVDARTGVRLRRLPDADGVFAAQTGRGPLLFLDQNDGPLALVDEYGRTQRTFIEPGKRTTYSLAVSADGRRLAVTWTRKDQNKVHPLIFDLTAPEQRPKVVLGALGPGTLTLSPDGRNLGISSSDGHRVIDLETDRERWFSREYKVFLFAFSADGRRIVASAPGGTDLRQIDLATGAVVDVYRGHKGDVACAAYSPDGRWLVSGGRDRTVRLWSLERDEPLVFHGHANDVRLVAFTADGARLATLDEQGEARIWDVRGPGVLRGHTNFVYTVAFSPDGRWLASGGWDKCVRLWDAGTRAPLAVLTEHDFVDRFVSALAIHPDGTRLVSLCGDYSLRVWDTGGERRGRVFARGPWVHPSLPHQIQFSPDGRRLAVGDKKRVRLWDASTLRECESLPVPIGDVRQVLFSPDGRRLAVGGDLEVLILDAATGRQEWACRHEHEITAVAFSPDGRRLLTADRHGEARLSDVASGEVQATLRGHVGEVFAAAFHPSGERLATAGRDRAICLWDVARGEEVLRLTGHTDYVFGLAWSPDGATLASASGDQTVPRFWAALPVPQ